jgi:hypothetical protein
MKGRKERHKIAEERWASFLDEFLSYEYSNSIPFTVLFVQHSSLPDTKEPFQLFKERSMQITVQIPNFSAPEYLFVLHLKGLDDTKFFGSRQSLS